MSQPAPPGPGEAAPDTLLGDLISYYREGAGEGRLGVCRQAALTHRAQWLLSTGHTPQLHLPEDVAPDLGAAHSQRASSTQRVCQELVQALEFLELISANLLLFPWRKEIRSLKMYTGNFVYRVRPVLSQRSLHILLGRLGYVATSEAEFSLVQTIGEEDIKQMVFDIFLARVACEAALRTEGIQTVRPSREELTRPCCQHHSERRQVKANGLKGVQAGPGPSEGTGFERVLTKGPDPQSPLPTALSLPEVPTAPHDPLPPLAPQRRASTRSDSEEFLTCYSDLLLHRTPLLSKDLPRSSLKGKQPLGPALAPSPSSGEAAVLSGHSGEQPLAPDAAPEHRGATAPSQLCLAPAPQRSGPSSAAKAEGRLELGPAGTDTAPVGASSEMDALCKQFSHHLRPPTLEGRPGGFPGCGVEKNGQSKPLEGPEPAGEGSSPESRVTRLWKAAQDPSHVREPPSALYVPPGRLEAPVPTWAAAEAALPGWHGADTLTRQIASLPGREAPGEAADLAPRRRGQ